MPDLFLAFFINNIYPAQIPSLMFSPIQIFIIMPRKRIKVKRLLASTNAKRKKLIVASRRYYHKPQLAI